MPGEVLSSKGGGAGRGASCGSPPGSRSCWLWVGRAGSSTVEVAASPPAAGRCRCLLSQRPSRWCGLVGPGRPCGHLVDGAATGIDQDEGVAFCKLERSRGGDLHHPTASDGPVQVLAAAGGIDQPPAVQAMVFGVVLSRVTSSWPRSAPTGSGRAATISTSPAVTCPGPVLPPPGIGGLGLPWITVGCDENHRSCVTVPPLFATAVPQAVSEDLMRDNGGGAMSAMHRSRIRPGGAKDSGAMFVDCIGGQLGLHVLDPTWRRLAQPRAMR